MKKKSVCVLLVESGKERNVIYECMQDLCVFEGKCHVILNVVVNDIW